MSNVFSDPVFLLFLGFVVFAVIYGIILLYVVSKDKGKRASR